VSERLGGHDLESGLEVEEDVESVVRVLLLLERLQHLRLPHPTSQNALHRNRVFVKQLACP
jgi:hypothetical protein